MVNKLKTKKINLNKFYKQFEENMKKKKYIIKKNKVSQLTINKIFKNMKTIIYNFLTSLINFKNPFKYILSSSEMRYSSSILLIIIGFILLLLTLIFIN